MSRIAGIVTATTDQTPRLIDRMLAAQLYANASAYHAISTAAAVGWCGIGTTRLRVRGPLYAVLDGTIYNRRELGPAAAGDVDILLSLFEQYGFTGALQRINGDFAVALYDSTANTLWLGRDRFGIKPLYYSCSDKSLAFASQPRALLAVDGVSRRANKQFVALFAGSHYRTFDNDPAASPFADIRQLPAACVLQAVNGKVGSITPYWSLTDQPEFELPEQELAHRYRDLLTDAVTLRYRAAAKPAFTLSGGMDSSSVLACAVLSTGSKQHAFSSVYEDRTYDESEEIRSMLEQTVEQWYPTRIATPDLFELVARMVRCHDEPVATATWLSHFLLCEAAASQGFGALFGGLGGDELNAGEYEYFFFHFADLRRAGTTNALTHEIECWAAHHDHPIHRKNMAVVEDAFERMVNFQTPGVCLPDRRRLMRYAAALNPEFFDLGAFQPLMDHPFRSYLKNRTYQDIFRETAPCCLRAEDRQTTLFGMDHFDPFFDHRLAEFMFRVPGQLKIRDGVTKTLLREAMRGVLPEETRARIKKTGWNAPAHVWFSGRVMNELRDLVGSREFREKGVYCVPEVLRIIDEHSEIVNSGAARENHMMFLWQLVNLESWLREYGVEL